MELLKSRFRFHTEHFTLILFLFFLAAVISQIIAEAKAPNGDPTFLVVGLFVLLAGLAYFGNKILSVPRIVINIHAIILYFPFKKVLIPWHDITGIELTGKQSRGVVLNNEETTVLKLNDGRHIILWAEFYSNMAAIRRLLEKFEVGLEGRRVQVSASFLNADKKNGLKNPVVEQNGNFRKYAGHSFLNFDVLLFTGFAGFLLWLMLSAKSPGPGVLAILILPILFLYYVTSTQLHYFLISDRQLVVRNHFMPWRKSVYNIETIREVVFERAYRKSRSLRIITCDFNDRPFGAGSLRDKHWAALNASLSSAGILIRDEI